MSSTDKAFVWLIGLALGSLVVITIAALFSHDRTEFAIKHLESQGYTVSRTK